MIAENVEYMNCGMLRITVILVQQLHSATLMITNPIVDTVEKYMAEVVLIVLLVIGALDVLISTGSLEAIVFECLEDIKENNFIKLNN